jgi:hypothetical protein
MPPGPGAMPSVSSRATAASASTGRSSSRPTAKSTTLPFARRPSSTPTRQRPPRPAAAGTTRTTRTPTAWTTSRGTTASSRAPRSSSSSDGPVTLLVLPLLSATPDCLAPCRHGPVPCRSCTYCRSFNHLSLSFICSAIVKMVMPSKSGESSMGSSSGAGEGHGEGMQGEREMR